MIKGNINFLRMVKRTIDYLMLNKVIWQNNIALMTIVKLILEFNLKLEKYQTQQQVKIIGYAQKRKAQKNKVVMITDAIASAIRAYASTVNEDVLYGKVKYSRSSIWLLRDEEFESLSNTIITVSISLLNELVEYNITQDTIDNYTKELSLYKEIRTEPMRAIKKRKAATASIKINMVEFREIIKDRLDGMMKQYEITHPDFYMEYTKQREIVDTPTHKLSLKGNVTDIKTQKPLLAVIVTIPQLEKETESTELGNYQFKNINRGTYKVEFQREGYKLKTLATEILDNQTTDMNVEMERN